MKKILLAFFVSALLPKILLGASLTYEEKLGDKTFTTTYQIAETEKERLIQSENEIEKYSMTFSPSYQIEKIHFASKKNDDHYEITYDRGVIYVEGKMGGKEKKKVFSLHGKPWIQNLCFGLIPFASSSQNSISFYIVQPENLVLYQMRAKKMGQENLTLRGKTHLAEKIEVRLSGFKSLFWKAELWFDTTTHQMVFYQSDESSQTPLNTLELIAYRP